MSVRSFSNSSIKTGEKRSKFWDQNTVILYGAYESIASATGTGSSGTITFSSIPSTYQHLQIRAIMRNDEATTGARPFQIRFNSDSGTNYASHLLYGDGATVTAAGNTSQTAYAATNLVLRNGNTSNVMSVAIVDIHDYSSSTKNKTLRNFLGYDLNGSGVVHLNSGLWNNTSAISSISLIVSSGNWTTQTTFALYGIKAAA